MEYNAQMQLPLATRSIVTSTVINKFNATFQTNSINSLLISNIARLEKLFVIKEFYFSEEFYLVY
jgi:hypothetical protein